jgi:hypothetical protein
MIAQSPPENNICVGFSDLFYAYRKAKADCFFEHSINIAREFSKFEENLVENLEDLIAAINFGGMKSVLLANLGTPKIVAKKLSTQTKTPDNLSSGHRYFSDPQRAFENLKSTYDLIPEFRLIGNFPVQMHILSALWVNKVGHKFDAILSKSSYGSRLRRYRKDPTDMEQKVGDYHLDAIGSFEPYFDRYKQWRQNGLTAIRDELAADRPVIAISMDLTSYYHRIDPSFIANPQFLSHSKIFLTDWELTFTQAFADALSAWSDLVAEKLKKFGCEGSAAELGGLPIGLSISPVVANALLADLDTDIEKGLAPVFYGRYVDDLFIVLRDPENLLDATDLLNFIGARTTWFPKLVKKDDDKIVLHPPNGIQNNTNLILQPSKQKLFFLQGQAGLDLLNNIETQIRSVSSERRLMPSPDKLELMTSAKVLTAAGHPSEEADTLRRADGLAVRRLGWSIQLRAVETLARDLRQQDWKDERQKFYQFAHSHILRPDRILDHLDYLPRLLSLTVALMDWTEAQKLVTGSIAAIKTLESELAQGRIRLNGIDTEAGSSEAWDELQKAVKASASEAIVRSLRWSQKDGSMRPLCETALKLCQSLEIGSSYEEIAQESLLLRESDWAKVSYKDHLRRDAARQRPLANKEEVLDGLYSHEKDLLDFLEKSKQPQSGSSGVRINRRCIVSQSSPAFSNIPFLFPTRPYTTQEISLFLPEACIYGENGNDPAREWARFVRAARGVWVWGNLVTEHPILPNPHAGNLKTKIANLGVGRAKTGVRLGISSLLTTDTSFKAGASGKSDLSPERYKRIETIVNHAIEAHPKPTHLLLPELALPERWLDTVAGRLRDAGISLIAGLDYVHTEKKLINSEAVLTLLDDRLGFSSSIQIRQAKSLPAAGEEEALLKFFGKEWPEDLNGQIKPIYIHQGCCFGVLVCSELQNMSHRHAFQGNVDCMIILSWNQDLETFSALVESASLDVHAYVALVNNRKYGDSRVRAPAKQHHARDLCRIRGGENEHLVVVELDIKGLRSFQSRAKRWPSEADPYKPVPEGFRVSSFRKSIPK